MTLKVLFLSSDTGGGHRASAESLAAQFELLYPGSTYELLDVMTKDGLPPYNRMVESYKHLSAHPQQWNIVFKFSNSRAFEFFFDVSNKLLCEKAMRKSIMEHNPDVVVSVHPLMTNVPISCCQKISKETGRHLPIFTVVTDLGSAHCLWFANGVDKMYIASDQCRELAKVRGKVPDEKIVQIGLPIRHQFAEQADLLGDRKSHAGIAYQQTLRAQLALPLVDVHQKTVLVMGGGEGVGSLSNIVDSLYVEFTSQGIDALILVVCGRNQKLKADLEQRDWETVIHQYNDVKLRQSRSLSTFSFSSCVTSATGVPHSSSTNVEPTVGGGGCMDGGVTQQIRRILSTSSMGNAVTGLIEVNNSNNNSRDSDDNDEQKRSTSSSPIGSLPPMIEVDGDDNGNRDDDDNGNRDGEESSELADIVTPLVGRSEDVDTDLGTVAATIETAAAIAPTLKRGNVAVVGLGFVTNMAEYMVVADVLVSKAGPGTIAEAASLSLPVMLTSFLPGQEEGNVDFVVDGEFGAFVSDKDPIGIAEEVARWLLDEEKSMNLSQAAKKCGAPHAARDIVKSIGSMSLKWKKLNDDRDRLNAAAAKLKLGIASSHDEDDEVITE